MKICPNCDFENFDNLQNCDGCGHSIQNIRPEYFTIIDFIKKNSEVYAVIGIFLALFQYFFSSQDPNVKLVSLFPLFVSIYLLFSLIIKGDRIVNSQLYENTFNRYFNANSFQFRIFLFINASLFIGLILNVGTHYFLSICIIGSIAVTFVIFIRKILDEWNLSIISIWLNLLGIFFIETGWLIFQFFLPFIKNPTDPTLFYWTLMIPLFFLGIGIGIFLANMFIGIWMITTETQRNRDNQIHYTWASLRQEFTQYLQISDIRMTLFLGLIILLGIGILSIFFSPS
jgi:type IV secretory pathway VirB3-like protein